MLFYLEENVHLTSSQFVACGTSQKQKPEVPWLSKSVKQCQTISDLAWNTVRNIEARTKPVPYGDYGLVVKQVR